MERIGLLFAAALLTALLSGCGGSQTASSSTVIVRHSASLSKAQFVSRGDAICESAREESEPLKEEYRRLYAELNPDNEATQSPKLGETVDTIAENTESEVERLRSLEAPKADRKTINKMLALVDSEVLLTEELAIALEVDDADSIETLLNQAKPVGAKARGMAQGYGFKVCGGG